MEKSATMITDETYLTKKQELTTTDLDGEIGMMDIERGQYYALDKIGSRIWNLLDEVKTSAEVCRILLGEYEIDEATCQIQVVEFLNDLYQKDLLCIGE
ncbi:MAG: PqqD family peptide modification chaperone [Peptococcaceae bacterium]|nr:PqqD family peptide modification chaperone [Peptococcaceae bacterium]